MALVWFHPIGFRWRCGCCFSACAGAPDLGPDCMGVSRTVSTVRHNTVIAATLAFDDQGRLHLE